MPHRLRSGHACCAQFSSELTEFSRLFSLALKSNLAFDESSATEVISHHQEQNVTVTQDGVGGAVGGGAWFVHKKISRATLLKKNTVP